MCKANGDDRNARDKLVIIKRGPEIKLKAVVWSKPVVVVTTSSGV